MLILAVLTKRYTVCKYVEYGFIDISANILDLMSHCGKVQADL